MDTMSSYLTYSRCCKTLPTISCVSIAVESVSSVAAAIVASSYVVAILLTLVIYFVTFIALYSYYVTSNDIVPKPHKISKSY